MLIITGGITTTIIHMAGMVMAPVQLVGTVQLAAGVGMSIRHTLITPLTLFGTTTALRLVRVTRFFRSATRATPETVDATIATT